MVAPAHHNRPIYPHAPIRLVVAEIRFPLAPALLAPDTLATIADGLAPVLPVVKPLAPSITFTVSGGGPEGPITLPPQQHGFRFLARDQMSSVSIGPTACVVETTQYLGWARFRELIRAAMDVLGIRLSALAGIERIGLRYFNEIRLPRDATSLEVWREYVIPEAIASHEVTARLIDRTPRQALTTTHFVGEGDNELVLRHGVLQGAVVGEGPLQLPSPAQPGPFYLIDIDSFRTMAGALPPFSLEQTLAIADQLHEPVDMVFEGLITDKLRDEVFR